MIFLMHWKNHLNTRKYTWRIDVSWSQKEKAKIIAESYKNWNLKNKKILDVGCGNGVVSQVLNEILEADISGTDIIDYCKQDISFKKMDSPNKLPFEDNSFDFVMFIESLHHSENIEELIIEANRVASDILIFEDKELFFLKTLDVGLNYLYCKDMPVPCNFKTEKAWCNLFIKLGFSYVKAEISYPFWYPLRHFVFKLSKDENI